MLEKLKKKYPTAISWSFGDSEQLADELATLVIEGKKTVTCSSLSGFLVIVLFLSLVVLALFSIVITSLYVLFEHALYG